MKLRVMEPDGNPSKEPENIIKTPLSSFADERR